MLLKQDWLPSAAHCPPFGASSSSAQGGQPRPTAQQRRADVSHPCERWRRESLLVKMARGDGSSRSCSRHSALRFCRARYKMAGLAPSGNTARRNRCGRLSHADNDERWQPNCIPHQQTFGRLPNCVAHPRALRCPGNQNELSACLAPIRGAARVVTDVGAGCRMAHQSPGRNSCATSGVCRTANRVVLALQAALNVAGESSGDGGNKPGHRDEHYNRKAMRRKVRMRMSIGRRQPSRYGVR